MLHHGHRFVRSGRSDAEKTLQPLHLELQQRAFVPVAAAVDTDVAPGTGQIIGLKVFQRVGTDGGVGLAQCGVALHDGFQIGTSGNPVALQKTGASRRLVRLSVSSSAGLFFKSNGSCSSCAQAGTPVRPTHAIRHFHTTRLRRCGTEEMAVEGWCIETETGADGVRLCRIDYP